MAASVTTNGSPSQASARRGYHLAAGTPTPPSGYSGAERVGAGRRIGAGPSQHPEPGPQARQKAAELDELAVGHRCSQIQPKALQEALAGVQGFPGRLDVGPDGGQRLGAQGCRLVGIVLDVLAI